MAYDALELVKLRKNFYRDNYRIVVIALLISLLIICLLVGLIYYLETHQRKPTYFATTSSGRLIPMTPLNQPNMSDHAVLQWTSKAITSLYSYDFQNYRESFQNDKQYFTDQGWRAFLNGLKQSGNLKTVKKQKLTVQAVPESAPVVVRKGVHNGIYSWRIQMPIVVTYRSLNQEYTQHLLVTVLVQRLSTLSSKHGIGIAQIVERQRQQ